jgi:hypothetical protein
MNQILAFQQSILNSPFQTVNSCFLSSYAKHFTILSETVNMIY